MVHSDSYQSIEFTVFLAKISSKRWSFEYKVNGQPMCSGGEWCPSSAVAIEEATMLARRDIEGLLARRAGA